MNGQLADILACINDLSPTPMHGLNSVGASTFYLGTKTSSRGTWGDDSMLVRCGKNCILDLMKL